VLGGDAPSWTLTIVIFPPAVGMSLLNLTVDVPPTALPSDAIADRFVEVYAPDVADAAFVHAEPQWTQLAGGPYKPPLVTTPTFAGVFWANYIAGAHLAEFDVAALHAVRAHRVHWQGDDGLALISAPRLEDALTAAGESDLRRLTAAFRAAKRPDA
jgi:hypothetical protein